MTEQAIFEGKISVKAVLRSGNRDVSKIYINKNKQNKDTAGLEKLARSAGVEIEHVDSEFIDSHTTGKTHGGVIAFAGKRKFVTLQDLVPESSPAFIVMLDGIEDPFNFGQAVRSLYAAGTDGIVVRPRNWTSAAGIVARSSAGASELIPMAVAESAEDAARFFTDKGLTIACTAKRKAISLYEADLTGPLFILMGGEKRGITRSFIDTADIILQVPYGRNFDQSLGMGSAAAIIAFEVMRQRKTPSGIR